MIIFGPCLIANAKCSCKVTVLYILVASLLLLRATALAATADSAKTETKVTTVDKVEKHGDLPKGKICLGTSGRMSVPANREHHYRNLRDRYTNCTYVDGNLEITWVQDEHIDLSFLQYIREVTGYVLISHVDVSKIVLPRLQIIRGRTLFKLNIQEESFALMVTLSTMNSLELPGLRDILAGNVGFYNNYNLCHIKTINWEEILTGVNATSKYVYNFTTTERVCPPCDKSCSHGCWGEGPENCQKFSKINCSPQCYQGRCFGPEPRQCCHLFCAGGCTGPKQTDCLACRSVYDDGVCSQECPPMQRYNPSTYSWETNPNGKYAYGATCVKSCPGHLLKDNGACVKSCPPNKKVSDNNECIPCDGVCPKTCKGVVQINNDNVDLFKDCTVIEGSITILDTTFKGYQDVDENYKFGAVIGAMPPEKLEVFSTLKEITGYLNIQGDHPNFTSLSFLRNLEVIGGRELTQNYFASLYVARTSLRYLGLNSLKRINSGCVVILENEHLCYNEGMNWTNIKKSTEHHTLLQNNKKFEKCQTNGEVCDPECKSGCWGPGRERCVSCKNFTFGNLCLPNCSALPGLYRANSTHCKQCDKECESVCHGPGPENCKLCKNVRDGNVCKSSCPIDKYNTSGECKPCHKNCVGGCKGPENNIGQNGCNSCDKAIIYGIEVECLQATESCPDGFYSEWQGPIESGQMKALSNKQICRRCHPRCKKCTGYGFYEPACIECVHYKRGQACEEECPSNYYPNNVTHECLPCSSECNDCTGPDSTDCLSCRNLKVYLSGGGPGSNTSIFNCTSTCPPQFPYVAIPEDNSKPYCSVEPSGLTQHAGNKQWPLITIGCICSLIILCMVFVVFCKRQQQEKKENAIKMSMIFNGIDDDHPLHESDAKPNMRILKIFKENQIRKGNELGSGAFGRVYEGVLFAEAGNKTKPIPVAIKVLKEGTKPEKNKETLEEAYIMASVNHKYLLTLIGVCMTNEMMIITPLMPVGCLLDFVQKNKNTIRSKKMLTWCQQIAEGMAYLEERKLIHRDLAARNVLLAVNHCVKITDFGLARLLDMNEESYKADGSKVPVKWLALECIRHKIFTHKSDVWAFGVTIWELLTYGKKPYGNIPHTDVPELLEKGERLPQPRIATMEVYKTMLSCWFLTPESRPTFQELVQEFRRMVPNSQKYLLTNEQLLTEPEDEKDLSVPIESEDTLVDSEDYLQPSCSNIGIPISNGSLTQNQLNWDGILQYPNHLQCLKESVTTSDEMSNSSNSKREVQIGNLKLDLPLDDDDYLMPSPQRSQSLTATATSAAYMDLISDSKSSDENQNTRLNSTTKPFGMEFMQQQQQQQQHPCVYNLEYHLVNNDQKLGIPQVHQLQHRSSEEESDHEYYNDFDRLQRELQPLRRNRNETPV